MKPTDPHMHRPAAGPAHDGPVDNPDVDHEHSDINIRKVLGFAIALTVIVLVVFVLMWALFQGLESSAASNDPQVSPLAVPAGELPPEPRLLTNEPANLAKLRENEAKMLGGYGWVDQAAGVAHMPIDEAKKLILERGIPARAGGPADPELGAWGASRGESNSGRMLGKPAPAGAPAPAAPPKAPAAEHKEH
jgi:hypothetical protein